MEHRSQQSTDRQSAALENPKNDSAIEMLLTQPGLLDNLRKGYLGNYSPILSLLGCLDDGFEAKRLADKVIDACQSTLFFGFLGVFTVRQVMMWST